jgi:hypothetical protein
VLTRSIESAAAVDPIWNRPQLIGGGGVGVSLGQVTIDHDLSYDALAADEIEADLLASRRMQARPAA